MSRRTLVYFVCSPHSRTGVTTTARLLTDYHLWRGVPVEGFDTDAREPSYALRFPRSSTVVDIFDVRGQIALFDRLLIPDETPKVVDVWSRSFDQLFSIIAEIGFFEEAERMDVEPIVLFHTDASQMAASNARLLTTTWPRLWLTTVNNEGAAPLGPDAREIMENYSARAKIVLPRLERPIANALDDPHLSLSGLLMDSPISMSLVVRAALKNWLMPVFTQFRSHELRIALQSSQFLR
jgi:hypothetical protein